LPELWAVFGAAGCPAGRAAFAVAGFGAGGLAAAGGGAGVAVRAWDVATVTGAASAGFGFDLAILDAGFFVLLLSVAGFSATVFSRLFATVAGVFDPAFALAVVALVLVSALAPPALSFFAGAALLRVSAALLFGFDFFAMGRS
jgi:hypothetical protein